MRGDRMDKEKFTEWLKAQMQVASKLEQQAKANGDKLNEVVHYGKISSMMIILDMVESGRFDA